MQIVYLSDRPDVLAETWAHVRHFMPWIDHGVVSLPASRASACVDDRFRDRLDGLVVVTDEELTGLTQDELSVLDHVRRNVTIRRALIERTDLVEGAFVLSDDDYRPIRPVDREFFGDDCGDIGYFSYDLAVWPGDSTDFDEAQHVTHQAMAYLGFPHLSYGAHMPQLMRKDLWRSAFSRFDRLTDDPMVCEWTLYFNVGLATAAERFAEPRPFQTLCWPQYANEWPWWVRPASFAFENFYPELYSAGHLFSGLTTSIEPDTAERTNFEKLLRWSRFGQRSAALDFPADIANPWTQDSSVRKATFSALRRLRKAYDYLSLEDRSAMVELSGTVARLEHELRLRDRRKGPES